MPVISRMLCGGTLLWSEIMGSYNITDTMIEIRNHPGEPVPKENFWTLWCKKKLTKAHMPTIQLGATPSRLTSAHLHHPPHFLQASCPSCHPTNSVKALAATLSLLTVLSILTTLLRCNWFVENRFKLRPKTGWTSLHKRNKDFDIRYK